MPRIDWSVLDPTGQRHGVPTYPWGRAPGGLFTRRQLRAIGRCPGGREPVAQLLAPRRDGGFTVAYLYDIALSKPKRTVSQAVLNAVAVALRARRTCPDCGRDAGFDLGRRIGVCMDCDPTAWGLTA
jgi:hypothetical protein